MDVNLFTKVLSPPLLGLLVKIKTCPSILPKVRIDFLVAVFLEAAVIYDIQRLAYIVHVHMCDIQYLSALYVLAPMIILKNVNIIL